MSTPIFSRLKKFHSENRVSFAMPGHKNGRGLDLELLNCDVTELKSTCDLHGKSDAVLRSQKLISQHYGSDVSYIVTGGSTNCIQAMLAGNLKRGETVLASCDCHMSVVNTCALCGFNLRFIPKNVGASNVMRGLLPIEPILEKYPDIKAVIITSPTYYGICEDIEKMAHICHKKGIPLLVDEAHGAHFGVCGFLPQSAVSLGADAVCQSAHKTLNALTGAAFLHLSGEYINKARTEAALHMFSSSSPSYAVAASAECAILAPNLENEWNEICRLCSEFGEKIRKATKINVLENDDVTRIVLNFSQYCITGARVADCLADKYGIDAEMSDGENVVLIATPSNTYGDFKKLYGALCEITAQTEECGCVQHILPPPVNSDIIRPYEGFYGEKERVLLNESAGRICAGNVCAYPPGIPVIVMGAEITDEQILYINELVRCGVNVTGMDEELIEVIVP